MAKELDVEMEFGADTEQYGSRRKAGESNAKWIGAKFDLSDAHDLDIVEKAAILEKRVGSLKRLIAAMVKYVYVREIGKD